MSSNYQDLKVWKKSLDLTIAVYACTSDFPNYELHGSLIKCEGQCLSRATLSRVKTDRPIVTLPTFFVTPAVLGMSLKHKH
jgi:hypothetical protein